MQCAAVRATARRDTLSGKKSPAECLAAAEARAGAMVGPGLPAGLNVAEVTTADAVRPLGRGWVSKFSSGVATTV
ncbi:hypothetical protein DEFR109230_12515 [Deinococcus frigens]|uniref:hypothetical protein n=1 Tax=Deinococcus frigens TaxID=249403 RepID=UPI000AE6E98F|nr:hypothetical protein [Deinococcus frigens]